MNKYFHYVMDNKYSGIIILTSILVFSGIISSITMNIFTTYVSPMPAMIGGISNSCMFYLIYKLLDFSFGCRETNTSILNISRKMVIILTGIGGIFGILRREIHPYEFYNTNKGFRILGGINFICISICFIVFAYIYQKNPRIDSSIITTIRLCIILLLILTIIFAVGTPYISVLITTALANTLILWVLVIDTFRENILKYTLKNDLSTGFAGGFLVINSVAGIRLILELIQSTNNGAIRIIVLTLFYGVNYFALYLLVNRILQVEYAALFIFCIQLLLMFITQVLFIATTIEAFDFWAMLVLNSFFHVFRNLGVTEDLEEWLHLRFRNTYYIKQLLSCIFGMINEFDSKHNKMNSDMDLYTQGADGQDVYMFLFKTQGEILNLVTPLIMILVLSIDTCFILFGGRGSITYGMTSTQRSMGMVMLAIVFLSKIIGLNNTRMFLQNKGILLEKHLEFLLSQSNSIITNNTNNTTTNNNNSDMITTTTADNDISYDLFSQIEFTKARIRINKLYRLTVLLPSIKSIRIVPTPTYITLQVKGDEDNVYMNSSNKNQHGNQHGLELELDMKNMLNLPVSKVEEKQMINTHKDLLVVSNNISATATADSMSISTSLPFKSNLNIDDIQQIENGNSSGINTSNNNTNGDLNSFQLSQQTPSPPQQQTVPINKLQSPSSQPHAIGNHGPNMTTRPVLSRSTKAALSRRNLLNVDIFQDPGALFNKHIKTHVDVYTCSCFAFIFNLFFAVALTKWDKVHGTTGSVW